MFFESARPELIDKLTSIGVSIKEGSFDERRPIFYKKEVVIEIFPFLANLIDDDGLISASELYNSFAPIEGTCFMDRAPEFMKSGSTPFAIMLHPYFRRNLSSYNNFFAPLVDSIYFAYKRENLNMKLRIDLDRITLSKYALRVQERDYWYGAKFIADVPKNSLDVTKYTSSPRETLCNGSSFTEFYWKNKDVSHIQLEIEQIHNCETPNLAKELYGCKYLHTVYDKQHANFEHIDGAIRAYTKDEISARQYSQISEVGRAGFYTKIFRLDGNIPFETWKHLISDFFPFNLAICDYFEGEVESSCK